MDFLLKIGLYVTALTIVAHVRMKVLRPAQHTQAQTVSFVHVRAKFVLGPHHNNYDGAASVLRHICLSVCVSVPLNFFVLTKFGII